MFRLQRNRRHIVHFWFGCCQPICARKFLNFRSNLKFIILKQYLYLKMTCGIGAGIPYIGSVFILISDWRVGKSGIVKASMVFFAFLQNNLNLFYQNFRKKSKSLHLPIPIHEPKARIRMAHSSIFIVKVSKHIENVVSLDCRIFIFISTIRETSMSGYTKKDWSQQNSYQSHVQSNLTTK